MKKGLFKHGIAIIVIAVFAFLATGSGGTYTYRGNTAILDYEGDKVTATISGDKLSGTYKGDSFTAVRIYDENFPTSKTNPFMGSWESTDGYIVFGDTEWLVIPK